MRHATAVALLAFAGACTQQSTTGSTQGSPDASVTGGSSTSLAAGTSSSSTSLIPSSSLAQSSSSMSAEPSSSAPMSSSRSGTPVAPGTAGPRFPDGIEPGDPSECEAPMGKRCYWVDAAAPAGGDGSFASPWRGLTEAEAALAGGDFLYVRGLFEGVTLSLGGDASGTSTAPTTVKSWRGSPRAIFDGGGVDGVIGVANSGGIRLLNFEVRNFGDRGIVIADFVRFAELDSLVVHTGRVTQPSGIGGGIVLYAQDSLHDLTVRNCLIHHTTDGQEGGNVGALSLISEPTAEAGSRYLVKDNVLHDNYVAIRNKHAGRVHMEAVGNVVRDNAQGFHLRVWSAELHHNILVGNAVGLYLESDNMHADHDYVVHHNTFHANQFLVLTTPDQGGFVATLHLQDNIWSAPTGAQGVLHVGAFEWNWGMNDISSWTMARNVFWYAPANADFIFSPPPTDNLRKDFAASKAQLGDTTSVFADPLFVDAAAGDFHVREGSPAIGLAEGGGTAGAFDSP